MSQTRINTTGLDVLMVNALRLGLEKADANMVRVANDILNNVAVDDALSQVDIEIVPYDVDDKSMRRIVLEAPEYIIDEITAALKERRRLAEFGGLSG